jgi:hypothetical protein
MNETNITPPIRQLPGGVRSANFPPPAIEASDPLPINLYKFRLVLARGDYIALIRAYIFR